MRKYKGTADAGDMTLTVGLDNGDAGQLALKNAHADRSKGNYNIRITLNDGLPGDPTAEPPVPAVPPTTFYFGAKVMNNTVAGSGRSQRYIPCENTAADAGEEFRIAPEAYAEAEDQGEIVAVVHSHPDATSRPSAADVAMCNASGLTWHILSWPEGDLRTIEPVDQVPLLGRAFVHGVQDCWQVCAGR